MKKIIVLGAGPAGVVSALGLKKLGYEVVLISKKRPFDAIEGFSKRTIEGLQRANCLHALSTIGEYLPRSVTWNKQSYQNNHEYIVKRKAFDEALLQDAKEQGIEVILGAGKILDIKNSVVQVNTVQKEADFIVDARGRFAPRKTIKKSKDTSAFLIKYKQVNKKLQTSLSTSAYGWVWKAQDGQNMNYIQLTSNSKEGKTHLKQLLKERKQHHLINHKITVREASSYLSKEVIVDNYLRIGDAACAVDPLSGNGVFQALSTALLSPYVVHTLLQGSLDDIEAAKHFFQNRVNDIFYRYTRMGREFYEMEQQYKTKFWKERSIWPDLKESHPTIKEPYIEQAAVLIAPFIKKNEVVITNDNPMGVWRLGNIDLIALTKQCLSVEKKFRNEVIQKYLKSLSLSFEQKKVALLWCDKNGLLQS